MSISIYFFASVRKNIAILSAVNFIFIDQSFIACLIILLSQTSMEKMQTAVFPRDQGNVVVVVLRKIFYQPMNFLQALIIFAHRIQKLRFLYVQTLHYSYAADIHNL